MRVLNNFKHVKSEVEGELEELRRFGFVWSFAEEPVPVAVDLAAMQTEVVNPTPLCEIEEMGQETAEIEEEDVCASDELDVLHTEVRNLTKRIAEKLKEGDEEELSKLRAKRRDLWEKIEEMEVENELVANTVCEVSVVGDDSKVKEMEERMREINKTYFRQREVSKEMWDVLKVITCQRDVNAMVTWPYATTEFIYVALIAGIAVEGVNLILSPDPVSLEAEICKMEKLFPKAKFVFSREMLKKPPSIMFVFDYHCVSKLGVFYVERYACQVTETVGKYPASQLVMFSEIASKGIEDDVSNVLLLQFQRFRSSFDLPRVFISVVEKTDPGIILSVIQERGSCNDKGVILCSSPRDCEKVSLLLNGNGIQSAFLHNLMSEDHSKEVLASWNEGNVRVIIMIIGYLVPTCSIDYLVYSGVPMSIDMLYLHLKRVGKFCSICFNKTDVILTKRNASNQNAFHSVLSFVQESTVCRKQALCSYFGEDVPPCIHQCDNCTSRTAQITLDIVTEARIPELVDQLNTYRIATPTVPLITSILCGSYDSEGNIDKLRPWIGTVKPEHSAYVEGAIRSLVMNGALKSVQSNNQFGNKTYFTTTH